MPTRLLPDENDRRVIAEIRKGQASAVIDRMPATLLTNAVIGMIACLISMSERGPNSPALYWFITLLATITVRAVLTVWLKRLDPALSAPVRTLRLMTVGAFFSGLTWASLPFIFDNFDALGADSGLYLMMLGMGAGAVLMGADNSSVPLAFAMPPHVAVIVSLIPHGAQGILVGISVAALTLLLYMGSRLAEANFAANTQGKLHATALAESLSRANAGLERLANRDPLTGLANRTAFNSALADGIARCGDDGRVALLVVDLDGFKMVNDTLGHSVGDQLLVFIGNRMRHTIEGADVLARLGGDEFAIIYTGPDAVERARRQCEAMLERSHGPILIGGQSCIVGTSIGLSIYPDHAATAEELFVCADMALYRAKDGGRARWCEFHADFRAEANRRRQIEQDLPDAMTSGAIETWFQPQLTLDGRTVIGFEALVRWYHPDLGAISPPEIVAAAQAIRLSHRLTETVADSACLLLSRLPQLGLPQATVAINVSPREFGLYSVVDVIDAIAHRHEITPALLEIEITEEAMLDTGGAAEQLSRIGRSGYKLAVDDFGAGHSSLTYLTGLKVDRLKIDRGITASITSSAQSQNIVAALLSLGHALSIEVLVEGVETAEDVAVLQSLGCRSAQGYFFARPMPVERLTGWIAAASAPAKKGRSRVA